MKLIAAIFVVMFSVGTLNAKKTEVPSSKRVVLAYVVSGAKTMPDVTVVTHINYAFAHVNDSFDGIKIDNEPRLREIAELKKKHKKLKILLSIGGWGSGRFSEMAACDSLRTSFARACRDVIDNFGIDGVDIDWEYPTVSAADISASEEDIENYTLLMRDIRMAIGKRNLLTLASVSSGDYVDFRAIDPYIDFVNIMAYDISRPPYHHGALYSSSMTKGYTCQTSIDEHIKKGVPVEKLVLGVPFYGRGDDNVGNFINYSKLIELKSYVNKWDDKAKAPYLANENGDMVCSYDDARSLKEKAAFVRQRGLKGMMYWQYNGDDANGSLRRAVYEGIFAD